MGAGRVGSGCGLVGRGRYLLEWVQCPYTCHNLVCSEKTSRREWAQVGLGRVADWLVGDATYWDEYNAPTWHNLVPAGENGHKKGGFGLVGWGRYRLG